MKDDKQDQPAKTKKSVERAPYEAPTIIYEGLITTRAVSDDINSGNGKSGSDVESTDLFG